MFGVLQIDQGTLLETNDPNPVELRILTGIVILFHAGIDTPSAPDAT